MKAKPGELEGKSEKPLAPVVGDRFEISIERILPGGHGIAHHDGATVFVYLAAPGDRVLVSVEKVRGGIVWGNIEEILERSPLRVEPPCPYFGRCGGCDFQQLGYETQLETKLDILRDCLRRITKIEAPQGLKIVPSPSPWGYRSRAMWQFDRNLRSFGYYARGSHDVCDVTYCSVLTPGLQNTFRKVRQIVESGELPEGWRDIQAVEGDSDISVVPPPAGESSSETIRTVGHFQYRFSAEGFFQINQLLLPQLISAAVEPLGGKHVLDLYCGVGLFSLPLSTRFEKVTGVESNAEAIRYAKINARQAGSINTEFVDDVVGKWFESRGRHVNDVDAVLLDPPRVGAEKSTLRGIIALRPSRVSYVSCDPATLARDLRPFLEKGYSIESMTAFDMFPQTHHVETVTHLISIHT